MLRKNRRFSQFFLASSLVVSASFIVPTLHFDNADSNALRRAAKRTLEQSSFEMNVLVFKNRKMVPIVHYVYNAPDRELISQLPITPAGEQIIIGDCTYRALPNGQFLARQSTPSPVVSSLGSTGSLKLVIQLATHVKRHNLKSGSKFSFDLKSEYRDDEGPVSIPEGGTGFLIVKEGLVRSIRLNIPNSLDAKYEFANFGIGRKVNAPIQAQVVESIPDAEQLPGLSIEVPGMAGSCRGA